MEEMLEGTLEMDEDQELEGEADAEVDRVLFDLTNGKLGEAGSVSTELPVSATLPPKFHCTELQQSKQDQLDDEETERTMEQYRQQLNGLLSG